MTKYRIRWEWVENKVGGHGKPMDSRDMAQSCVDSLNRQYKGRIRHWVEEVKTVDEK